MYKIRELRKMRGLTQEQCANHLNMTPSGFNHLENGRRDLKLDDALLLADLFDCTLDELAGRTWPPKQTPVLSTADPLAGIPQDEITLLTAYRSTDDRGRETIQAIASAQPGEESILPAYKVG